MRISALVLLSLLLPLVVAAQMDDNTVTVVASKSSALQPDQVQISVYVDFESTAGLTDVLASVQSVGITEANLASVSSIFSLGQPVTTEWYFLMGVPFSKQGETLSTLAALQQSIDKTFNRKLGYSITGVQASSELLASAKCAYGPLFQDALLQAQTLADAAGVMLGPVVAVSDGMSVDAATIPTTAVRAVILDPLGFGVSQFDAGRAGFLLGIPSGPVPSSSTCTMSVQFKLIR